MTKQFTDTTIKKILNSAKEGNNIPDLCSKYGISRAIFNKWRANNSSSNVSLLEKMKSNQQEKKRLTKLLAQSLLDQEVLKEALSKKW